jgi:alkylation response protein AidB-like acyl-CoA dehydrogenase
VPWEPLTDEQLEIRELVRTLARERIAPRAAAIDESHEFPWDVVELFREHGIFGLLFDEEVGGTGTGTLLALVAIEEVSKVCATSGLILAVQELGSLGLKVAGSDEQKARYLPSLASGEVLAAYALTEAGLGVRLGGDAHDRTARRRRVRPRRLEAVHHERRCRRAVHGLRQDRSRRGPLRDLRVRRRSRHAGIRGRPTRAEDGHRRLDDG